MSLDIDTIKQFFGIKPVNTKSSSEYSALDKFIEGLAGLQQSSGGTTSKYQNHFRNPNETSKYYSTLGEATSAAKQYQARHVGTAHVVFDTESDEIIHTCMVDKESMYALH